jgi:hypothetical protein
LNSSQQLGEGLGGDDVGDDEWHTTSAQLLDAEGRRGCAGGERLG